MNERIASTTHVGWTAILVLLLWVGGCAGGTDVSAARAALGESDLPCGGVREAIALGVLPPEPPAMTSPPPGACPVSTTAELLAAVQNPECTDILLRPGVYPPEGLAPHGFLRFVHPNTHLWAVEPGSVVLEFGVSMDVQAGSGLHGLVIDVVDPAHAVAFDVWGHTAAVVFWGGGDGMTIEDTRILGHGHVHQGINAGQPKGLVLSRVEVDGFLRFGVRLPWVADAATPPVLTDLDVRNVGDPVWRTMPECTENDPIGTDACYAPGTAEHGIWIGTSGTLLDRARVRDIFWTGIITGSFPNVVANVVMRNVDVNRVGDGIPKRGGAAIGVERITHDLLVERFCVGPTVEQGVHAEWNHGNHVESATRLVVRRGVISAQYAGVYFDSGTLDSQLQSLHIRDASWSGLGLYRNYPTGSCNADPETCNTTVWSELTFDLAPAACALTYDHYDPLATPTCSAP